MRGTHVRIVSVRGDDQSRQDDEPNIGESKTQSNQVERVAISMQSLQQNSRPKATTTTTAVSQPEGTCPHFSRPYNHEISNDEHFSGTHVEAHE